MGGGGGGGVWNSLLIKKFGPLFIKLIFRNIHYNKTNYSLKVRKVTKKSDYSLLYWYSLIFSSIQ